MERRSRAIIDGELGELEKRMQTLRLREDEIQAVIESMYRLKDSVTTERMGLRAKALELQAEREPINWLPPELLIHIFMAFCDLDSTEYPRRAPFVLSQVCRKWRNIATSTPQVWRRVLIQTFSDNEQEIVKAQLKRSAAVPLEIAFSSSRKNMPNSEASQVANLLIGLKAHLHRTERLTLHCNNVMPFTYIAPILKKHTTRLPSLHDLTLSVGAPNPTFLEAMNLLSARWPKDDSEPVKGDTTGYSSPLRRLHLEQIPLLSIPKPFVANLHTLELFFPQSRSQARHQYRLKMSTLGRFLAATPLLEELVLNNTVPIFDTIPPIPKDNAANTPATGTNNPPESVTPWIEMAPIRLEHLKFIDWTFATSGAVHELFAFVHAPVLERLDLWIERSSSSTSPVPSAGTARDVNYIRWNDHLEGGSSDGSSRPHAVRGVLDFPCLRELDLQYPGEDTLASVLRRLRMPVLERAAFMEVEADPVKVTVRAADPVSELPTEATALPRAQRWMRTLWGGSSTSSTSKPNARPSSGHGRNHSQDSHTYMHTFPRLEAILFDPRLTHLTHLSLSHQHIARDTQRAEAMLGYMPVLTSLSLDACTGVRWLLEGLQELVLENGGRAVPSANSEPSKANGDKVEGGGAAGEKELVRVRRGVKVCPRLEALSFWNCPDVDSASVRKVITARNQQAGELVAVGACSAPQEAATGSGNGSGTSETATPGVTTPEGHAATDGDAATPLHASNSAGAAPGGTGTLARKIKPLRKPRLERVGVPGANGASGDGATGAVGGGTARLASTNIVSKMIAIEESFQPAHIIYLRVSNCILIDEDDLLALRDLDVVDVIWAGKEVF